MKIQGWGDRTVVSASIGLGVAVPSKRGAELVLSRPDASGPAACIKKHIPGPQSRLENEFHGKDQTQLGWDYPVIKCGITTLTLVGVWRG